MSLEINLIILTAANTKAIKQKIIDFRTREIMYKTIEKETRHKPRLSAPYLFFMKLLIFFII